jgi:hypothetical protein
VQEDGLPDCLTVWGLHVNGTAFSGDKPVILVSVRKLAGKLNLT